MGSQHVVRGVRLQPDLLRVGPPKGGPHIWLVAAAIIALSTPAAAQVTGSIAGIVRDPSGAVLPGVTVTVRGAALQRDSLSTTTGQDGSYRLTLLPPGVYDVAVELAGFATQTRRGVDVAVNQQTTLDVSMAVAG